MLSPLNIAATVQEPDWPLWAAYKAKFIQTDGRVIEYSQNSRTTSEGQAYALFHSLVADDRDTFKRVLNWTENNLADGSLGNQLPAWLWGERDDKSWGVLDRNAAADADMWLAYALLEAGRHWNITEYEELGKTILRHIEKSEIVLLPGAGAMVLPGPVGFVLDDNRWKLNPSYLAPQLILRFSAAGDRAIWHSVLHETAKMLETVSIKGVVPDWVVYSADTGYTHGDDSEYLVSSYDAIRVHLWLGMLASDSPLKSRLLKSVQTDCKINEKVSVNTLIAKGKTNPPGFLAARLPYFETADAKHCLSLASGLLRDSWKDNLLGSQRVYYDQNLALFGLGWMDRRFQFMADGQLALRGKTENVTYWKK